MQVLFGYPSTMVEVVVVVDVVLVVVVVLLQPDSCQCRCLEAMCRCFRWLPHDSAGRIWMRRLKRRYRGKIAREDGQSVGGEEEGTRKNTRSTIISRSLFLFFFVYEQLCFLIHSRSGSRKSRRSTLVAMAAIEITALERVGCEGQGWAFWCFNLYTCKCHYSFES